MLPKALFNKRMAGPLRSPQILLRFTPQNFAMRQRCVKFQRRFILKTKKEDPLAHKTIRRPWRIETQKEYCFKMLKLDLILSEVKT